jgi:hypothetical protein
VRYGHRTRRARFESLEQRAMLAGNVKLYGGFLEVTWLRISVSNSWRIRVGDSRDSKPF